MRVVPLAAAALTLSMIVVGPADAAKKRVNVPNKFDGQWSISIVTQEGPCDRAYRYGVQIVRGEAYYPGSDVQIRGSVSASGAVSGVISRGGDSAQVSGRLTTGGTGGGSWGSAGPISCRGSWTATRRG